MLQIAPGTFVWSDQGFFAFCGILLLLFAGLAGYINRVGDRHATKLDSFIEQYHRDQLAFLREWIPLRESKRAGRRVALTNALEEFKDDENPFTLEEKTLNNVAFHNIEALEQEEVRMLIEAWDRERKEVLERKANGETRSDDYRKLGAADIVLRELNDYLEELCQRDISEADLERKYAAVEQPKRRWLF